MAIRYDAKLNKEIRRVVANFNSKISRLEKLEQDLILPDRVTVRGIKQQSLSRPQLYNILNSLKRYSKRGVEKTIVTEGGVETSIYDLKETQRALAQAKRFLSREINQYGSSSPTVFGKKQSASFERMGDTRLLNLKYKRESLNKNILKLSNETYKRFREKVKKEATYSTTRKIKDARFMLNYTDKMITGLAYMVDYPASKVAYIQDKLMTLSPNQFVNVFNIEQSLKSLAFYYNSIQSGAVTPESVKNEVWAIYDELYNSIDSIVEDYLPIDNNSSANIE